MNRFRPSVLVSASALLAACQLTPPPPEVSTRSHALVAQEALVHPADISGGDSFGRGFAVDGDYLIAGSYGANAAGSSTGKADAFRWDGSAWVEEDLTLPATVADYHYFGAAISIDGEEAAIASAGSTLTRIEGSVYLYAREDGVWTDGVRIQSPATVDGGYFGYDVKLSGDELFIAAPNEGGNDEGVVYLYERDPVSGAWHHVGQIMSPNPSVNEGFGSSIAFDGDVLVVGATGHDIGDAIDTGMVYVFRRGAEGWQFETALPPLSPAPSLRLGKLSSLAVEGDLIAVGNYEENTYFDNNGAVHLYAYDGTTWNLDTTLWAADPAHIASLGWSLALRGDRLVAGAMNADGVSRRSGAVYVFERDASGAWTQRDKVFPSASYGYDRVGSYVGMRGAQILASAPSSDIYGTWTGAVYAFDLAECPSADELGAGEFCTPECPCAHGEGDCDEPEDCLSGLCLRDAGLQFGYDDPDLDVCSDVCPTTGVGAGNYCTPECPCAHGEGDCDSDEDCAGGRCLQNVGLDFGYDDPGLDVCSTECPEPGQVGVGEFCTPECPCEHGEGDCDSDEDCVSGLCLRDAGPAFGYDDSEIDVCSNICPTLGVGSLDYCSPACPCDAGEGDCDGDADCAPGLSCTDNVGPSYGFPAEVDVCESA